MKTQKLLVAASLISLLSFAGAASQKESHCVKIADLNVGNRSQTASYDIVRSEVLDKAQKTPSDKVVVKMVRHEHGKLGYRYYAQAHALKCN